VTAGPVAGHHGPKCTGPSRLRVKKKNRARLKKDGPHGGNKIKKRIRKEAG
jgi:hypothetical protein